ncbi:MAG: hypothetical protein GY714_15320 [Desulfobacterales bacterium]|nr:hypothetical protein [Desulfobacterales bacterium]
MNKISDKIIKETLGVNESNHYDFFLLEDDIGVSICKFIKGSGLFIVHIEDEDLDEACLNWLKNKGIEIFNSIDEVQK